MARARRGPSCSRGGALRLMWGSLTADPRSIALVVAGLAIFIAGVPANLTVLSLAGVAVLLVGLALPVLTELEVGPSKILLKTSDGKGRDAEFLPFMERERGHLHRFALLMTGDVPTATTIVEDALQDSYLVWRRLAEERRGSYVLCRVVHLTLGRSVFAGLLAAEAADARNLTPAASASADEVMRSVLRTAQVLSVLDAPRRAMLLLRHYEGFTDEAVARMLDRPVDEILNGVRDALAIVEVPAPSRAKARTS